MRIRSDAAGSPAPAGARVFVVGLKCADGEPVGKVRPREAWLLTREETESLRTFLGDERCRRALPESVRLADQVMCLEAIDETGEVWTLLCAATVVDAALQYVSEIAPTRWAMRANWWIDELPAEVFYLLCRKTTVSAENLVEELRALAASHPAN
jgi:hypothetical protein